jgi:hypothetical protein
LDRPFFLRLLAGASVDSVVGSVGTAPRHETGQKPFPEIHTFASSGLRRHFGLARRVQWVKSVLSRPADLGSRGDRWEERMNDNFDKAAIAVIIVFGALILGGLMAANIAYGHRNGFMWALGGATAAWIAGHTILFDMPRVYAVLIGIATLMAIASTVAFIF